MSERKRYEAWGERDGRFWLLRVPALGSATQARRMDQAEEMVRDLIALTQDVPPESFDVQLRWELEPALGDLVRRAIAAKGRAAAAQAVSSNLLRRAARAMTEAGYTVRDAGGVLGVSHQRIAQLIAAPEADVMEAAIDAAVGDVDSYVRIYDSGQAPKTAKWSDVKAAKGAVDDPAHRRAFADEVEAIQAEEGRS